MSGISRARSRIDEERRESKRASFKCDNRFRSNMQKSRALLPIFLTICGGSGISEFMNVVEFPNVEEDCNEMAPVVETGHGEEYSRDIAASSFVRVRVFGSS